MAYEITKIGNEYATAKRMTFMITSEDDLATLPTDCAIDSVAKTVDYSIYAILGLDRQWHRIA